MIACICQWILSFKFNRMYFALRDEIKVILMG